MPRDETHDKARQYGYQAKPVRCFACRAVADAQKQFESQEHIAGGIRYTVHPVE